MTQQPLNVYCDNLVTSLVRFRAFSTYCTRHYDEGKEKLAGQPIEALDRMAKMASELVEEVNKAVERRAGDLRRADPDLNLKQMLAPHKPSAAAVAAVAAAAMNEGDN